MQEHTNNPQTTPTAPSEFALDQLHVGEQTATESGVSQPATFPGLEERLALRQTRFAELHAKPDFQALLRKETKRHKELQARKATARQPRPAKWIEWLQHHSWFQLSMTCAAACVLIWLMPPNVSHTNNTSFETTQSTHTKRHPKPTKRVITIKSQRKTQTTRNARKAKGSVIQVGQWQFRVLSYRKGAPYPNWLRNNAPVQPGALIQFSFLAHRPKHIMIIGMNRSGETYPFVPYLGKHSQAVNQPSGKLPANSSLELDDYIGPERFFFFVSHKPFSFAAAKRALKKAFETHDKNVSKIQAIAGPWTTGTLLINKQSKQRH
jgi:hypothetical protein